MAKHRYKYHGDTEVEIPPVGIVKPNHSFESEVRITHPDVELLKEDHEKEHKKEEHKSEDKEAKSHK